jgi:hypothetical protein
VPWPTTPVPRATARATAKVPRNMRQ